MALLGLRRVVLAHQRPRCSREIEGEIEVAISAEVLAGGCVLLVTGGGVLLRSPRVTADPGLRPAAAAAAAAAVMRSVGLSRLHLRSTSLFEVSLGLGLGNQPNPSLTLTIP